MTDPSPHSPHPLGSDAPDKDYVGLAVAWMSSGITSGTAVIAATLWAVRSMMVDAAPSTTPDLNSPAANLLLTGTLAGILLAAVVTWRFLAPVGSTYRQGGLSMVAAFATIVVSLLAMPVDLLIGRWGVLGLATLFALLAWRLARRARRLALAA